MKEKWPLSTSCFNKHHNLDNNVGWCSNREDEWLRILIPFLSYEFSRTTKFIHFTNVIFFSITTFITHTHRVHFTACPPTISSLSLSLIRTLLHSVVGVYAVYFKRMKKGSGIGCTISKHQTPKHLVATGRICIICKFASCYLSEQIAVQWSSLFNHDHHRSSCMCWKLWIELSPFRNQRLTASPFNWLNCGAFTLRSGS